MSLKAAFEARNEPLRIAPSRKQMCGQKQTAPAIGAATVMENEATARSKLKDAGFDPDASVNDVAEIPGGVYSWGDPILHKITPIVFFSLRGDVPMCQYLRSKGASTTKKCEVRGRVSSGRRCCGLVFPMYAAVEGINSLEMCKWLYANGAQSDVRQQSNNGYTPITLAASDNNDELVRWLVLRGALCADDGSDIPTIPTKILRRARPAFERLVEWAGTATQPIRNPAVLAFLSGALPPKSNDDTDSSCILQYYLIGEPGIRKRIADYAGLYTKKEVSILRQVRDELPPFLAKPPPQKVVVLPRFMTSFD